MNSRERVAKALNHEQPDRPPFDCTFTIDAYNDLIKYLGLNLKPKKNSTIFSTVEVDLELIEEMKLDFVYVGLKTADKYEPFIFGVDNYKDMWGLEYKKVVLPNGVINYQAVNVPLRNAKVEDLDSYDWPDYRDDSMYVNLEREANNLYKDTELAIIGNFGGSIFTLASLLRGMEQWYVDLMINQDFAIKLLEILSNYYCNVYKKSLQICGKYLDLIRIDNDDYGTQNGLLISRKTFTDLIKPIVSNYYREIKAEYKKLNSRGKLMKHSCGDISAIIDDFIEMGVDVLDPVQVSAQGMKIDRLKEVYGDKLSFHGGIDTQDLLPFGNIEDVKYEVSKTIKTLGVSGGYIVSPVHHVEGDVPPENLVAIRDAVLNVS